MDEVSALFFDVLQTGGMFAPIAFILFHVLRQFVFVPVGVVCMIGGVFFGAVYGTLYSLIGLMLVSICFYVLFKQVPSLFKKVLRLKQKYFRRKTAFSFGQLTVLRLVPFVHFHLISLCLIEMTSGFREYMKASLMANMPLAVVYTMFGQWIGHLSPQWVVVCMFIVLTLLYVLRKKELVIKWDDFFQARSTQG